MDIAKALLNDTNKPISQIGYEIGFSDNHNFSSAFKKSQGKAHLTIEILTHNENYSMNDYTFME